jgi:hypothetical protein
MNLLRALTEEAIQIGGILVYYMPRTAGYVDPLLGEDSLSEYPLCVDMEAFPETIENWGGTGELISRFTGLTFDEKLTLSIAQHRWAQERNEMLYFTTAEMITYAGTNLFTLTGGVEQSSSGYVLPNVPKENDLIFIPTFNRIFVINHVDRDKDFFPLGVLPTYTLTCGVWDYSSERLSTGFTGIDIFQTQYSTDVLSQGQIIDATGNNVLTSSGDLLIDNTDTLDNDPFAGNDEIQGTADVSVICDEDNPLAGKKTY